MQFSHNDTVLLKVTNLLIGQRKVQNSEVTSQESEKSPLVTDHVSIFLMRQVLCTRHFSTIHGLSVAAVNFRFSVFENTF